MRPYPVTKRDKVGAGSRQRLDFVETGGIADAGDFDELRPPCQPLHNFLERRAPAAAIVDAAGFAERHIVGASLAREHGIITAAQAAGAGDPIGLQHGKRCGESIDPLQMRAVGAGARHNPGMAIDQRRDIAPLRHAGCRSGALDQRALLGLGKPE